MKDKLPSMKFRDAWVAGLIKKPVIILIGGYAGTGKSTVATVLSNKMSFAQIIPTGIFRSIAQSQNSIENNPALFLSTYDLNKVGLGSEKSICSAFESQCKPINEIIKSVIGFMAIEKQLLIIEGNHILPWCNYEIEGCYIIEMYLHVQDGSKHRTMIGGPTHSRSMSDDQFKTARIIDEMIIKGAKKGSKKLIEFNELSTAPLVYLEEQLANLLVTEGI